MSDCSKDCEGFLSADEDHEICIDRRLFQKHNVDPEDYEDHYHFLWRDLVGAVVWFITAGICKCFFILYYTISSANFLTKTNRASTSVFVSIYQPQRSPVELGEEEFTFL